MGSAGNWIHSFISGGLHVGSVVHGLGAQAWVRAIRRLSDYCRGFGAVLCVEARLTPFAWHPTHHCGHALFFDIIVWLWRGSAAQVEVFSGAAQYAK